MDKKIFNNVRLIPKGDTEANWNKAIGFVPLDKEIIIYKKDETHQIARFKIGDGVTVVQDLPFAGADIKAIQQLIDEKGELFIEYVDNTVAEAVEQLNSEIPTNLENGEGRDSLVQKYTGEVDDSHYGNTNTGENAIVFGEANTNAGNRSVMGGKLNSNTGVNASVSGTVNNNTGNNASVSGYKNINDAQNSTVGGRENKNYSEASAVIGSGNINGVESNTTESYGSNVYGGGNTNTGKYAGVGGSGNTNDGSSAIVGGQNNNNTGGRAIVGGMNNTNDGHDTIVVGKGLKNRHENLSVFGKYNDNKAVNLLEIGNGKDAEHPSNSFEVLKDGRAKSYGAPLEDNDLTTVKYVREKLSSIDISTNYMTTNTDQTGLNGSKSWAIESREYCDYSQSLDYPSCKILTTTFNIDPKNKKIFSTKFMGTPEESQTAPHLQEVVEDLNLSNNGLKLLHLVSLPGTKYYTTYAPNSITYNYSPPEDYTSSIVNTITLNFPSDSAVSTLETIATREYVQQYIRDNFATLMEEYLTSHSASYDEIISTPEEVTE